MAKTFGVTVKELLWTQRQYDIVTVMDAPDESSVMTPSLSLGALGNIPATDMKEIVDKML
jgi:uncharacterized protein with GYD domain